jgi:hypothetical protein
MRVRLRGINSKRKKLADGSFKTYYWAWKGGPPLRGEPGSPEFIASYNEAVAQKVAPPRGILLRLLQQYQASEDFRLLADSTRRSYIPLIARIEKAIGDFPLSALTDRRTRGIFLDWRDKIAATSGRRQADYGWTVLARVLSWSLNRGLIGSNPCEHGGRLYRSGARVDKIWTATRVSGTRTLASALAIAPCFVDRAATRRFASSALVRLRRHAYPVTPEQNRSARCHPCWRAAQSWAGCSTQVQHDYPHQS